MKKLFIVKSVMALILLILFFVSFTYAWLVYYDGFEGSVLPVGDIDYQYSGEFIDENIVIYPGLNLLETPISVDNQSDIGTQLRVKISYTLIEETVSTKVFRDDLSDDLAVEFSSVFINVEDYWYYQSTTFDIDSQGVIDILSSITYDGEKASIEYQNQPVSIHIQIQVKQTDHVEWADLVNYDFTTGNPA